MESNTEVLKQVNSEVSVVDVLPEQIIQLYGTCERYDWKGTELCEHAGSNVLCKERSDFLKLVLLESNYNVKEFINNYEQNKARVVCEIDYRNLNASMLALQEVRDELARLRKHGALEEELNPLLKHERKIFKEYLKYRTLWKDLWADMKRYGLKDLERITPKKIEVTEKKVLTVQQINEFIRQKRNEKVVQGEVVTNGTDNKVSEALQQ